MRLDASMSCGWRRAECESFALPFPRHTNVPISTARSTHIALNIINITSNFLLMTDDARLDCAASPHLFVPRRYHFHIQRTIRTSNMIVPGALPVSGVNSAGSSDRRRGEFIRWLCMSVCRMRRCRVKGSRLCGAGSSIDQSQNTAVCCSHLSQLCTKCSFWEQFCSL